MLTIIAVLLSLLLLINKYLRTIGKINNNPDMIQSPILMLLLHKTSSSLEKLKVHGADSIPLIRQVQNQELMELRKIKFSKNISTYT